MNNHLECVKALLAGGSATDATCTVRPSVARHQGDDTHTLITHMTCVPPPFDLFDSSSHSVRANQALAHAPLFIAALGGNLKCLLALLDAGAHVDATNSVRDPIPLPCLCCLRPPPAARLPPPALITECTGAAVT